VRKVVLDIVAFLNTGIAGDTLRATEHDFGSQDLRLFCVELASWWGRSTLMQSRHPYLGMRNDFPWQGQIRKFVESVPELKQLVCFDEESCRFAEEIGRDEWEAINEFIRANHKPRLCS
jgi:hypothetical protein